MSLAYNYELLNKLINDAINVARIIRNDVEQWDVGYANTLLSRLNEILTMLPGDEKC